MSFYRKYRPSVIDEIDNLLVRDRLLQLAGKEVSVLPHAYLLTGPKGVGKTTAARIIAKLFNCRDRKKTGPCGNCEQCTSISQGRNLDIIEMDAASNRGIDEIRTLRERIGLAPVSGRYTVYIIDEVHMLTTEAFNALLKTLEEPPAHAVFVLATTDPEKVPATIISRCQHIQFAKAQPAELEAALLRIIGKEKIAIDKDALSFLTGLSDGSFRDAVKYLEELSLSGVNITREKVAETIAVPMESETSGITDALLSGRTDQAIALTIGLIKSGREPRALAASITRQLSALIVKLSQGKNSGGGDRGDRQDQLSGLVRLSKLLVTAYADMKYSPVAELPLITAYLIFSPVSSDQIIKEEVAKPLNTGDKSLVTLQKLRECWSDVIAEVRVSNHSLAGILRSTRPKSVADGILVIEAFYKFHKDKLVEPRSLDTLTAAMKKLFGAALKLEVVLGKK